MRHYKDGHCYNGVEEFHPVYELQGFFTTLAMWFLGIGDIGICPSFGLLMLVLIFYYGSIGRRWFMIFGDFDSYFFVVERNVYFTESSEYVIPPPGPSPFFMFSLLILCSFFPGGVSTVVAMFYPETNKTVFSGTKVVWQGILCLIFIAV